MSTIDNWILIEELIRNNGHYQDDPRVFMIVEYENSNGRIAWGVTWENESPDRRRRYLDASPYIRNPRIIWSQSFVK